MDDDRIAGRTIAAARALLGMSQAELAKKARVSVPTVKRMEASTGAAPGLINNVAAIRAALEASGVEFLVESGGEGVRLRR